MRALRFHAFGSQPVVDEVPDAVRGPGEVLVRITAAALAHLDLTVASGTFGFRPELPYVGGVEGAGVVLDSDDLPAGTEVMLRGGGIGLNRDGTWQERVSVPRKAVTVLEPALPAPVAATFFVPTTTAAVVLQDVARLGADENVLVTGAAGAVGRSVAQQAALTGARVTGLVGRPDQLADLPPGVEGVLGSEAPGDEWAKTRPFTLLVDLLGGADLITRTGWVSAGGRAAIIGYVAGTSTSIDLPNWLLADVALLPVNMIRQERRARAVAPELIARLAAGELDVPVETVALAEAVDALQRMAEGRVRGRAALVF